MAGGMTLARGAIQIESLYEEIPKRNQISECIFYFIYFFVKYLFLTQIYLNFLLGFLIQIIDCIFNVKTENMNG